MTDRDDLLRRVRRANPAPPEGALPAEVADSKPPVAWIIEGKYAVGDTTPTTGAGHRRRGPAIAAAAFVIALAVSVPLLFFNRNGDDPVTGTAATTTTTTTAALPGIVGFPVSVDDAGLGTVGLVAVSAGEVWAVGGVGQPGLIGRLEDGAWTHWRLDPSPSGQVNGLAVAPDGTVWAAANSGVFSFDGAEWTRRFDDPAGAVGVSEDGTVWISGPLRDNWWWLARWDGESWVRVDPTPQAPPARGATSMTVSADGDVWIVGPSGWWLPDHLMRYHGTTMEEVQIWEYLDPCPGFLSELAVAPNGDLLVGGLANDIDRQVRVARFDGDEWTEWAAHDWPLFAESIGAFDMVAGPDGVLWFAFEGGLASVEGTEWTTRIEGPGVSVVDVAPDGTVWYADADGVHIFSTP